MRQLWLLPRLLVALWLSSDYVYTLRIYPSLLLSFLVPPIVAGEEDTIGTILGIGSSTSRQYTSHMLIM